MAAISLTHIKKQVDELATIINAPAELLPTYGSSIDMGHPHLEADYRGQLHFVVVERGTELERRTTANLDELLYWIFQGVTFSLACDYELAHRIADEDCRRIIFARQEELLGRLSARWQQKAREHHRRILPEYPFSDQVG